MPHWVKVSVSVWERDAACERDRFCLKAASISQACFTPSMRIGTITSTLKRSRVDCLPAAGGPSLRDRNVSPENPPALVKKCHHLCVCFTSDVCLLSSLSDFWSSWTTVWFFRVPGCIHDFCLLWFSSVCFKVFDVDHDGVLSRDELHEMVVALLEVWKDNRTDTLPVSFHRGHVVNDRCPGPRSESSTYFRTWIVPKIRRCSAATDTRPAFTL